MEKSSSPIKKQNAVNNAETKPEIRSDVGPDRSRKAGQVKDRGNVKKGGGRNNRSHRKNKIHNLTAALISVFSVLFMEVVLRLSCDTHDMNNSFAGFLYKVLFSIVFGLAIFFIASLFRTPKAKKIVYIVIFAILLLWFGTQVCIENNFHHYYTLSKIFGGGGDVAKEDNIRNIGFSIIFNHFFVLLLFAIPLIVYSVFGKRIIPKQTRPRYSVASAAASVVIYVMTVIIILNSAGRNNDPLASAALYKGQDFDQQTERFGLLQSTFLDLFSKRTVDLSSDNKHLTDDAKMADYQEKYTDKDDEGKPVEYGYNTMNIDFAARAATDSGTAQLLDNYFAGIQPSKQNKYTGMFKGKNMIFMTCEAFSPYFISEDLTPTLYKLINSGIVLKNYYQPEWGYSTSDGEYSGTTGLVPEDGKNSMKASKNNNLYFTLGNQFTRLGYYTVAYHNNTYTYYDRHLTHENLGYSKYVGYGNGLEQYIDKTWPESDLQMMQATVPDLIAHQPFHAYYMTVSGHCNYTYDGNYMANKNKDKVAGINASEQVKAYIACNLELEYAMEYLIDELDKAGILDDTVIVLNPDHYPYGLDNGWDTNTKDYYSELIAYSKGLPSYTVDQVIEIHKLGAVVWCGSIKEPIVVDEPVFSLDLLPTLSNLFGFEFDSRLLVGRDIFSDVGPLVFVRNKSWITAKGSYNSKLGTFTPASGVTMTQAEQDEYVSSINSIVRDKMDVSTEILESDYYGKLFGN